MIEQIVYLTNRLPTQTQKHCVDLKKFVIFEKKTTFLLSKQNVYLISKIPEWIFQNCNNNYYLKKYIIMQI